MTIKPITLTQPPYTEYQGWSEWENKFKPIKNHFRDSQHEEIAFETYGEEWEFVKSQDPKYVWTNIQGDMSDLIVAGFAFVNRLQYYITEIPWDNEDDYVLLSVETECECYDEDREDNDGEFGDANCLECDGYGLVTKYVGE
jgi:hypothetical protein